MLKTINLITLILGVIALSSCSKVDPNTQIDEGTISDGYYTSEEIGWTMRIPDGWTILSRKKVDEFERKGSELIGDTLGEDLDFQGLKNLLDLQKDQFNIFQSTSQPFEVEYDGEWEETNEALKDVLLETFQNQGIKAAISETRIENIDGVVFNIYDTTIFAPDGKVILHQTMYSSLINGYDFGANLSYNNEDFRDIMLTAWRESKFKK
ncbi:MAG: hypothetical protein QNK61_02815 [Akkermansiaceae bacterium]